MASKADKAKTYTTDDIMAAIPELRKTTAAIQDNNKAIQDTNKAIQESVAALEIRVKALELKPGDPAGLFESPKDLSPAISQFPSSTSSATDLGTNPTVVASAPATASLGCQP